MKGGGRIGGGAVRQAQAQIAASNDETAKFRTTKVTCPGNAVGKEYDAQIGHRYFDIGRYKADLISKIDCDAYLVEYDMAHHFEGAMTAPSNGWRRAT
jgi:hypothetical protein